MHESAERPAPLFNNVLTIPETGEMMLKVIILFILIISAINHGTAEEDMTSDLICPCECVMIISTCDCATAIQVKKEIAQMKENGFSEKQVFSALQAEYGKEILAHPEKTDTMSLWLAGASLSILLVFLGYIFARRLKMDVMPDAKKYEQRFEEEYRKFVSEIDEHDKNIESISKDSTYRE